MEIRFRIRKARETDAETIVDFNISMALETENKILPETSIRPGVGHIFLNPEYGFYLVAENQAGEIIGSLMITTEWSDWRNGLFWWIQSVYVLPGFRRQGVYRALYTHVKQMAVKEPDVCGFRLYVEKENSSAMRVYDKMGMTCTKYAMYEEITS